MDNNKMKKDFLKNAFEIILILALVWVGLDAINYFLGLKIALLLAFGLGIWSLILGNRKK
jgi:hypothetical protein